jgi:hypothetical protein
MPDLPHGLLGALTHERVLVTQRLHQWSDGPLIPQSRQHAHCFPAFRRIAPLQENDVLAHGLGRSIGGSHRDNEYPDHQHAETYSSNHLVSLPANQPDLMAIPGAGAG